MTDLDELEALAKELERDADLQDAWHKWELGWPAPAPLFNADTAARERKAGAGLLALIARVRAAEAGWQPIETAPRDGTVILVYRQDAGVFTAHFVEEDAHLSNALNPPEEDCFWFTTSGEDLTGDMPTHWCALPTPPEPLT